MKKIKEHRDESKDFYVHGLYELILAKKKKNPPKSGLQSQYNPYQNSTGILYRNRKKVLKFYMEPQGP